MRQRVLLVEDNEILAAGISALLVDEGFEVDVIGQGRPVIAMMARRCPDVLVLDLTLPDISGIAVAAAVRRKWPSLPIIFTSGHAELPGLQEALADSRSAMLQKPFEIQWLLDAIGRMTS
jgi:CheY-like chemotaxis protein